MSELNILQDVKTRWNRQYYATERLIKIKRALILALDEIDDLPSIRPEEWLIMCNLVDLFAPLEAATRVICGDTYATSSMIIPTTRAAIIHLTKLNLTAKEALRLRALLVANLNDRFSAYEVHPIASIATLLDPRFKEEGFKNKEISKSAANKLLELLNQLEDKTIEATSSAACSGNNNLNKEIKDSASFDVLACIQNHIDSNKFSNKF
jgi:hypothetical protein